jgi:hypothetical protein
LICYGERGRLRHGQGRDLRTQLVCSQYDRHSYIALCSHPISFSFVRPSFANPHILAIIRFSLIKLALCLSTSFLICYGERGRLRAPNMIVTHILPCARIPFPFPSFDPLSQTIRTSVVLSILSTYSCYNQVFSNQARVVFEYILFDLLRRARKTWRWW